MTEVRVTKEGRSSSIMYKEGMTVEKAKQEAYKMNQIVKKHSERDLVYYVV